MSLTRPALFLLALLATGCVAAPAEQAPAPAEPERQYINPRTPADADLAPFSGAVRVGNTLYLSGDIGVDVEEDQ